MVVPYPTSTHKLNALRKALSGAPFLFPCSQQCHLISLCQYIPASYKHTLSSGLKKELKALAKLKKVSTSKTFLVTMQR